MTLPSRVTATPHHGATKGNRRPINADKRGMEGEGGARKSQLTGGKHEGREGRTVGEFDSWQSFLNLAAPGR